MTHLLPPNLLKLFAPRPPLPYVRPLGAPPERISDKRLTGVAAILAQIREENQNAVVAHGKGGVEEGEEPEEHFTYVEEVRRQIHREEKKKQKTQQFSSAKENCE